ncbi:Helicase associated domain protein [Streptomyces sp. NPDC000941]
MIPRPSGHQASQLEGHNAPTGSVLELRTYQSEAVEAIVSALADGGRAQLHAACGSGKSLVGAVAGMRLVPGGGLLVVLVPSLSLVAQTLTTWRDHTRLDAFLAVCSDDTVTDAPTHTSDIDSDVTTDPAVIAAWLTGGRGRRLIAGTYQSAHRLAEALRDTGQTADLVVLDEAHHLAGRPDFVTRRVLEDAFLPARRRLFMTATPRIDDVRVETVGGLSMDDRTVFGPAAYSYPWARAISEGYLEDYRIVVMGVTESQAMKLLQDDEHAFVDRAGAPDLRTLAAQAVITKAARQYGLRRILAFCPRLDAAREFTRTLPSTAARLPADQRPDGVVHADHIHGEMSNRQRQTVLDRLRRPPGEWIVVSNVRCLSEGVDVPAVDAVAFTHPKRSQVDIVQAVGRALRPSPGGSGTATIIVPIIIPDSAEQVTDLDPGEFRTLWQVVRALRAHDEALGIELDIHRSHGTTQNPQLPSRITIELPSGTSDQVLQQLKAITVRQTTSAWWEGYGHARTYYSAHGHLNVPFQYVTQEGGFRLGQWIVNARQHHRKGWMRRDRIEALDKIGMIWETKARPWKLFTDELKTFRQSFGHALVPQSYISPSGYRLGQKMNSTRSNPHRVPEHVRSTLDSLGMVWNTRHARWQQLHTAAYEYREQHGHLEVPARYTAPDGYPLGAKIKAYRKLWREGRIDPAEQSSLEELGMRFKTADHSWREFLAACDRYIAAHGDLNVRKDYVDPGGYRLGKTMGYYRALYAGTKAGGLADDRRKALEERGMVWRVNTARDLTADEAEALRRIPAARQGEEVMRLLEEVGITQSSIAAALRVHRSHLNGKIKKYRETRSWPVRQRKNDRP